MRSSHEVDSRRLGLRMLEFARDAVDFSVLANPFLQKFHRALLSVPSVGRPKKYISLYPKTRAISIDKS